MGLYRTKAIWQKWLQRLVAYAVRNQMHPNIFTAGGLTFAFIAAGSLASAQVNRQALWLVPIGLLLRLLFNLMDGQVARGLGVADKWGEVKNEFGDRIADAAIFLALTAYADLRLIAFALTLILLASYLGILGKALGYERIYAGVFGKGDRMISLAIFTLYPLLIGDLASFNWYLGFACIASVITISQRLRILHGYAQSAR